MIAIILALAAIIAPTIAQSSSSTTSTTATSSPTPSTVQSAGGFTYIGCYTDASPRTLNAATYSGGSNTVEYCASFCSAYAYFGVEWSQVRDLTSWQSHHKHLLEDSVAAVEECADGKNY